MKSGDRVGRLALACAGICILCGCSSDPEALASLLPDPIIDIEVPQQKPPFLMSTGGTPQVYLLLGYNDVYSTGLIELTDKLNAEGIRAKWLNGNTWLAFIAEIKQAHAKGTLKGDLILVGHSFGGDDAVNVAAKVADDGVPVRLIVLVDATSPAPIPRNVDYCYNIYKPTLAGDLFPNSFAGNPVERAPGNTHTRIINEAVTVANFGWAANRIEHFSIDSEPLIHQAVINKIKEIEGLAGSDT